jgi:hypothetical protein
MMTAVFPSIAARRPGYFTGGASGLRRPRKLAAIEILLEL